VQANAMFRYMSDPAFQVRRQAVHDTMMAELLLQGNELIGPAHDLDNRWNEYITDAYLSMGNDMRRFGRVTLAELQMNQYQLGDNQPNFEVADILNLIYWWTNLVARWRYPTEP
jgi:hypothetical protein